MKYLLLLATTLILNSCTDATISKYAALGNPGTIVCYSGTLKIYEGKSTGVIHTVENSDGWEFKDANTGELIRVSGACVIRN